MKKIIGIALSIALSLVPCMSAFAAEASPEAFHVGTSDSRNYTLNVDNEYPRRSVTAYIYEDNNWVWPENIASALDVFIAAVPSGATYIDGLGSRHKNDTERVMLVADYTLPYRTSRSLDHNEDLLDMIGSTPQAIGTLTIAADGSTRESTISVVCDQYYYFMEMLLGELGELFDLDYRVSGMTIFATTNRDMTGKVIQDPDLFPEIGISPQPSDDETPAITYDPPAVIDYPLEAPDESPKPPVIIMD